MKILITLSLLALFFSCNKTKKTTPTPSVATEIKKSISISPFTQKIEEKHHKKRYLDHNIISFDIDVKFGGKDYLNGTFTQLTDGTKIRFDTKNKAFKVIYNGNEVFVSPKNTETDRARFDIFTWSYFFNFPYKLNDPGTIWSSPSKKLLNGSLHQTEKLSFKPSIGDAPDDWYIIYKNPIDNTLAGASYIISYGKDLAEAEKEPHAIKYNDYQIINGIPFSKNWTFHNWNTKDGYGDQIGEVTISNIKFLDTDSGLFAKPDDSKTIPTP